MKKIKQVRIKDLGMSFMDIMIVMSDGNPGALTTMMTMMDKAESIDPDSILGGLGKIMSLDTHGIYGSRIWQLYSDVCKKNMNTTLGLMRAVQFGFLSEHKLSHAIDNYGEGLDIGNLLKQVKERLPNFTLEEQITTL